jgi:hypothetical protein
MAEKLKSLWTGEIPLPEVFWQYAVVYGLLVNFVATSLSLVLAVAGASVWIYVAVFFLPTPYNVLMIVAVWRSAERYQGPRKWADLARAVTLIGMLLLTVS